MKLNSWIYTGLNGFLAIAFGLIAVLVPGVTLVALAIYFAITMIIGGIALSVGAIRRKGDFTHWGTVLFEGIIGLLLGLVILIRPAQSAAIFVLVFGIWALIFGVGLMILYLRRPRTARDRNLLLTTGIFSLLLGVLIVINPFESSRAITVLIGIYAILYGISSLIRHRRER